MTNLMNLIYDFKSTKVGRFLLIIGNGGLFKINAMPIRVP